MALQALHSNFSPKQIFRLKPSMLICAFPIEYERGSAFGILDMTTDPQYIPAIQFTYAVIISIWSLELTHFLLGTLCSACSNLSSILFQIF